MPATSSCVPCCSVPLSVNVPGVAGEDGTNGTDGANAYTTLTNDLVVPAVGSTVGASVANSDWMVVGQIVIAEGPANFLVTAIPGSTSVTLEFLGYPGDISPGATISSGAAVSPSGMRGGGSQYVTQTANNLTLGAFDDFVEVTADNKTITLPTAVGIRGKVYTIKQTASYTSGTTIATTGGQTIDGSGSATLSAQYKFKTVISNNANWLVIGAN